MNWLEFIEKMFGHMAWPLVVLIVLFSVRKHVSSLAERILELSFGGATVKFDKLLTRGAELIEESPALEPPALSMDDDPQPQGMVDIVSSYTAVENAIGEIAPLLGVKTRDPSTIMRMLWKHGLVSEELLKLQETLRQARNAAMHGVLYTLTASEEKEYARQALFLALNLHRVSIELKERKKGAP
jgi:hypothetical protein